MLETTIRTAASLAIFLFSLSQTLAQDKPTCAALTFDARVGVSVPESQMLSDRFATEFDRLGRYTIVARSMMREILDEQQFQATDHCSAAACAVEAGQLLGVRFMVYGTIGRLGEIYSVNSFMVDVETGQQIRSATTDMEGEIGQALTWLMSANARQLLGMEPPPRPEVQPRREPEPHREQEGYFNISLSPARADLRLNNQSVRPGLVSVVPNRQHTVTASMRGYTAYRDQHRTSHGETRDIAVLLSRSRNVYVTPKIGYSYFTGIAGVELQAWNVSLSLGLLDERSTAFGGKFYLSPYSHSFHFGVCGYYRSNSAKKTIDDPRNKEDFIGGSVGYRWLFDTGVSLTVGGGVGQTTHGDRSTVTTEVAIDLAVGYSF